MTMRESFVKERNDALFSLDRKTIEAYCAKHGDTETAELPDQVFWAGVYINEKEYARAKKYYRKLTGADIVIAD